MISIYGAGLAGCCLARELDRLGADWQLFEAYCPLPASQVAPGLVIDRNPKNGKLLHAPDFDSRAWYRQQAGDLGSFDEDVTTVFLPPNTRGPSNAEGGDRTREPINTDGGDKALVELGMATLHRQWRLRVAEFVKAVRSWAGRLNRLHVIDVLDGQIAPGAGSGIRVHTGGWVDKNLSVLEEVPWLVRHLVPARGDLIEIRTQALDLPSDPFGCVVLSDGKTTISAIPELGTVADIPVYSYCRWLVGSTWEWEHLDAPPQRSQADKLLIQARDLITGVFGNQSLSTDLALMGHVVGVRPCASDHLPIVGALDSAQTCYLLNGLGPRGVMWAPYAAYSLALHLVEGHKVPSDIHLRRFSPTATG